MPLLEKLMKPLLDAQYEKGYEIGFKIGYEMGYQQGLEIAAKKIEAWKERQRAVGVIFVPEPEDGDDAGGKK